MAGGWGGRRVGSGRKPSKRPKEIALATRDGVSVAMPVAPIVATPVGATAIAPPPRLSGSALDYWHEWAPLAIANGTLTIETVPGFEMLCEEAARRDFLTRLIAEKGELFLKASTGTAYELRPHPAESTRQKAVKQVESLMARYLIAAMGKSIAPQVPKEDDELAQLRQLLAIR